MQAATGQAVQTLCTVAQAGEKESDRARAAALTLDHGFRGLGVDDGGQEAAPESRPRHGTRAGRKNTEEAAAGMW